MIRLSRERASEQWCDLYKSHLCTASTTRSSDEEVSDRKNAAQFYTSNVMQAAEDEVGSRSLAGRRWLRAGTATWQKRTKDERTERS